MKQKKQQIASDRQLQQNHLWAYPLLGVFLVAVFFTRNLSGDVWWHLMTGRWILEHRAFPHTDPFSYTANHPVVLYEWLSDVSSWIIYSKISPSALAAVAVLSMSSAFCISYIVAFKRTKDTLVSIIIVALGAAASMQFAEMRPQVYSYLFFAATIAILSRYYHRGDKSIWLIAPLFVLWTNFHTVVLMGIAATLIEAVSCWVAPPEWASRLEKPRKTALTPFMLALICGVLVLIKPNSHEVYSYLIAVNNHAGTAMLSEWGSPTFHDLPGILLLALIATVMISIAYMLNKPKFRDCAYVGSFLLLALMTRRQIPMFAIATAPAISVWLASALEGLKTPSSENIWKNVRTVAWVIIAILTGSLAVWRINDASGMSAFNYMNKTEVFPTEACRFILKNRPASPMLNDINYGGSLIFHLWPEYKVFVDTRQGPYIGGAWEESAAAMSPPSPMAWRSVLQKYGINLVIINSEYPLSTILGEQPDWVMAYRDEKAVVFIRDIPANHKLIRSLTER